MDIKIFAMNLVVPLLVVLAIAAITGYFGIKKKESIKGEVLEYFIKLWKAEKKEPGPGDEEHFFQRFLKMFVQTYEYEEYKESVNKSKYNLDKLLVLLVILCIPFLVLFLITGKEWILNDTEWNNIYLYATILVPVIFAYLVNKYIKVKKYHETWYRHMQNRHTMECRMIEFIKDYELLKAGIKSGKTEEPEISPDSLKADFINDMCECWKSAAEITVVAGDKEDNILSDLGDLFVKN